MEDKMNIRNFKDMEQVRKVINSVHNSISIMNNKVGIGSISLTFGYAGKEGKQIATEVQINVPDYGEVKRILAIQMLKAITAMVKNHENKDTIFDSFNKIINEKDNTIQKGERNENVFKSDTEKPMA